MPPSPSRRASQIRCSMRTVRRLLFTPARTTTRPTRPAKPAAEPPVGESSKAVSRRGCMRRASLRLALTFHAHQSPALALPRAFLERFAFVVQLLAAREGDLDLGPPLLVKVKL